MGLQFDHIAVTCADLEQGVRFVEETLGVALLPGGKHAHFGTHNSVLGLEDGLYLEVIAPDPEAPQPVSPRWFGLDSAPATPHLGRWICRTDRLEALTKRLYGQNVLPVDLQRDDVKWRMGLGQASETPWDGLFPPMIDWLGSQPVGDRLPPSRCALVELEVTHPDAASLSKRLSEFGFQDARVTFDNGPAPLIRAKIRCPNGEVWV